MTGPLTKPAGKLMEVLEEKDAELFAWLNEAQENGEDVVYVSLGSIVKWQQWCVDTVYFGLKKLGCKVIWSLKNFELPEENPNFWVRPWIPQVEILAHPALKTGITHCGFGGTLEFINAGVPVVAFPHFADQFGNADLMIKAGAAVELGRNKFTMKTEDAVTIKKPIFDEEHVCKVFKEAMTKKEGMKKLQTLCSITGGSNLACDVIEQAYQTKGSTHLNDDNLKKFHTTYNCCQAFFCKMLALAIAFSFLWLLY